MCECSSFARRIIFCLAFSTWNRRKNLLKNVEIAGFEPAAFCVPRRRSNQLSYIPSVIISAIFVSSISISAEK